MARPEKRKARKDYPEHGIAKGDEYWYVSIKTGARSSRVMRQKTPFKRSQLTQSDYLSQLYDWEDEKADIGQMEDAESFAERIRDLGNEQQEKLDNMPEGLQQGDTGQMIQERIDACENAASEIEEIISEWESDRDDHESKKRDFEEYEKARDEWDENSGEDPPEEVEDPGEFDEDEYLTRVKDVSVE